MISIVHHDTATIVPKQTRHIDTNEMNVAGRALGTEKGRRYLAQLDQALCDGKWAEVPELARKTEKHAPEKHCSSIHSQQHELLY